MKITLLFSQVVMGLAPLLGHEGELVKTMLIIKKLIVKNYNIIEL